MRMRQRRAARCVLRAEVALQAGCVDDARAALEEARRLGASAPELDALDNALLAGVMAEPMPERGRGFHGAAAIAATIMLIAAMSAGAWFWRGGQATTQEIAAAMHAPIAMPAASQPQAVSPSPVSATRLGETSGVVQSEIQRANQQPDALPGADATRTVATTFQVPALAVGELPAPQPADLTVPQPRTAEPEPPVTTPELGTAAPIPVLTSAPGMTVPAPPPPADERPRVRAALARYEAAYSALDAEAVRNVWPGVDTPSLARAFAGLQSQRFSLGQCSVAVEATIARAECSGTATWTPKIGAGTQSVARTWHFELLNADGTWLIVRAQTR